MSERRLRITVEGPAGDDMPEGAQALEYLEVFVRAALGLDDDFKVTVEELAAEAAEGEAAA